MKTENRCSFEIDYSEIPGEKILPFTVSLNTEESVLYPLKVSSRNSAILLQVWDRTCPNMQI